MTKKTLRDEIAIAAMQIIFTKPHVSSCNYGYYNAAKEAYEIADIMLAERDKEKANG